MKSITKISIVFFCVVCLVIAVGGVAYAFQQKNLKEKDFNISKRIQTEGVDKVVQDLFDENQILKEEVTLEQLNQIEIGDNINTANLINKGKNQLRVKKLFAEYENKKENLLVNDLIGLNIEMDNLRTDDSNLYSNYKAKYQNMSDKATQNQKYLDATLLITSNNNPSKEDIENLKKEIEKNQKGELRNKLLSSLTNAETKIVTSKTTITEDSTKEKTVETPKESTEQIQTNKENSLIDVTPPE